MFTSLFLILAILNSVFLIAIFILTRMGRLRFVKAAGYCYFALAVPAVYLLITCWNQAQAVQYSIFLGLFILYLILEYVYDYILQIDFRRNWKLLVPYLILYYAMNFGFFAMAWKNSKTGGSIVLALTLVQIVANVMSHKISGKEAKHN
jgi:hypothetical protein